tara:strand:- start:563 stop:976 length:414 start_codon:yes stop_codon:yes gene_type:complete
MKKKSKKKQSELITTTEDVVVNSDKKVCNLFKTKPELSVGWIDEEGHGLTDPDDINNFFKRQREHEKEKSSTGKGGLKNRIVEGKMTRGQAVTEIKNQLRRKREQKALDDYKRSMENDTYQGDGAEQIIEKGNDRTI